MEKENAKEKVKEKKPPKHFKLESIDSIRRPSKNVL